MSVWKYVHWNFYNTLEFVKNGKVDRKAACDSAYNKGHSTLIKSIMVGNTHYAAVKNNETGEVTAHIMFTSSDKKHGHNFGFKHTEEWYTPPTETRCPDSILDLLTPTDKKGALVWRELCRDYNKKKHERKKKLLEIREAELIKIHTTTPVQLDKDEAVILIEKDRNLVLGRLEPNRRGDGNRWVILKIFEDADFPKDIYVFQKDIVIMGDIEILHE